jgi:hypothetical protein
MRTLSSMLITLSTRPGLLIMPTSPPNKFFLALRRLKRNARILRKLDNPNQRNPPRRMEERLVLEFSSK